MLRVSLLTRIDHLARLLDADLDQFLLLLGSGRLLQLGAWMPLLGHEVVILFNLGQHERVLVLPILVVRRRHGTPATIRMATHAVLVDFPPSILGARRPVVVVVVLIHDTASFLRVGGPVVVAGKRPGQVSADPLPLDAGEDAAQVVQREVGVGARRHGLGSALRQRRVRPVRCVDVGALEEAGQKGVRFAVREARRAVYVVCGEGREAGHFRQKTVLAGRQEREGRG